VDNIQEGMKHQMGGATQAQQGITFAITLIFTFYFLPSEPDLSQNVRTGLKTGAGISRRVRTAQHWFSPTYLVNLLRLVTQQNCAPTTEECNKYDLTADPCF